MCRPRGRCAGLGGPMGRSEQWLRRPGHGPHIGPCRYVRCPCAGTQDAYVTSKLLAFWSGASFLRSDNGGTLSDDLARLIVVQLARGWEPFKRFVLDADAADGGAASARRHLQWELGALARVLLEKD